MSTLTPISTQTLSSTASSITFTGIPQTYTDLVLVVEGTSSGGLAFRLNSDTGTTYSRTIIYGDGSSALSTRGSNENYAYQTPVAPGTGNRFVATYHFQNYANTVTNKTVLYRLSTSATGVSAGVNLWRSTAAINSIQILSDVGSGGTFASGNTFTLYGIGAGSPKAFGGDEVRTDGTYWYHIFNSSGVFAPMKNLSCDYLVVAGGGAGNRNPNDSRRGGGGGAGGFLTSIGGSPLSLSNGTNYTVTVGAGGAGNTTGNAGNGSDSVFASITSTGGGGGGDTNGQNGGSGGGASDGNGGTGSSGQGNNGGTNNSTSSGGGGGGAGAAGSNGVFATNSGNGGNGLSSSITGTSVTYAGGGGGGFNGTGGTGGGGAGGTSPVAGTANTGGGGGGNGTISSTKFAGGNGGSGIVVVRYLVA